MNEKNKDLVSKMTLEEKTSLCSGESMFETKEIDRLGIGKIRMCDGPHGVRNQKGAQDFLGVNESEVATCFPTASLTGCSFDRELLKKLGVYLGKNAKKEELDVLLGPGINIKRSPLCGRNFEYFSEDPYLTGELASCYVKGLQSEGVGSSLKHFIANNQENRRRTQSSNMDERTMREIYASAFEKVVKEAKPWTVMSSYNKIDGIYATENQKYQVDLLRNEWGFDGMVVSDWAAVHDRVEAMKGGCNLTMPGEKQTDYQLVNAIKKGELEENVLDESLVDLLNLIDKCKSKKEIEEYDYDEAHIVAKEIAKESMVLLKNEDNVLPIDKNKNILIVGKFAEKTRYQGAGSSKVNPYKISDILSVVDIKNNLNIKYCEGFGFEQGVDEKLENEALENAKKADVVLIFAGLPEIMESEGFDRWCMKLPVCQNQLIDKICDVQSNTVVVLQNGSAVEMPWVEKPKAILESYLGGESSAEAIWDILIGESNPSGCLAETFPLRYEDSPAYLFWPGEGDVVEYPEGVFVGYRYYVSKNQEVLFPFGHGLSYTSFKYSNLKMDVEEKIYIKDLENKINVSVDVTNTGNRTGKVVVQLYVGVDLRTMSIKRPIRELKGFEKIELNPGETKTVKFKMDKSSFAIWDNGSHKFRVVGGTYKIEIGKSVENIVLEKEILVENEFQPRGIKYNIMTPICEVVEHPIGKAFIDEIMEELNKRIANYNKTGMIEKMPYYELMPKTIGLQIEPLQTIKRILTGSSITEEKWEELFEKLNN